jgi:hypothetical protein
LVAKAVAPGLIHKSDVGGVVLGLESPATVTAAVATLRERINAFGRPLEAVFLQHEVRGGVEALVGVTSIPPAAGERRRRPRDALPAPPWSRSSRDARAGSQSRQGARARPGVVVVDTRMRVGRCPPVRGALIDRTGCSAVLPKKAKIRHPSSDPSDAAALVFTQTAPFGLAGSLRHPTDGAPS